MENFPFNLGTQWNYFMLKITDFRAILKLVWTTINEKHDSSYLALCYCICIEICLTSVDLARQALCSLCFVIVIECALLDECEYKKSFEGYYLSFLRFVNWRISVKLNNKITDIAMPMFNPILMKFKLERPKNNVYSIRLGCLHSFVFVP